MNDQNTAKEVKSTELEPKGGSGTPLMTQYNQIKAQYPDAILLYRVGDFYETFGQDAVKVAGAIGITLTRRNNGGGDTELAGFPYHSLDMYLPRLVRAGFRVAICDQLEKPSPLKKIVKRGVTEVVTPGVTSNDNLLENKRNNFLCCMHFGVKNAVGLAFLDISTGEFMVSEGDTAYADKLVQSLQPTEIIFSKSRRKDIEKLFGDRIYSYGLEEWVFTEDYTREKLLKQYEVHNLKGFGIEELSLAQVAAGAALHYLATTENKNLQHLSSIQRIQPDRYVWLDRFTIRNLELLGTPNENGKPLLQVLDKTTSPMGARLLKKWVVLPLKELKSIEARHDVVRFFIDKGETGEDARKDIRMVGDLERLISKVPLGKVNPREVKQLERSLDCIERLKALMATTGVPQLESMAERMNPCLVLKERIRKELVENPTSKIDTSDVIADGVSEELDELRSLIRNSQEHLLALQQREAARTGIDGLKVGFNSVFGYYLEVTNKYKDKNLIPPDWVRKQTLAGAERYITDELKTLETKILGAEEKIQDLQDRLFQALVLAINDYIQPIQHNASLVAQLDCLLSFAEIAVQHNYCRPQMNDGLAIDIKEGRHPVIEQHLPVGEPYVPNDVFLDSEDQQIIMVTGPNMAGKSALLRQTALICLMAQMGSFVPARTAKLGILDKVFTRVGASDNLSAGESTFMVEMSETASILNNISERSLILLDEIGRGTSTYDGVSIAWSIAEYLHDNSLARPKTLFATHYHELNELTERFPRIQNFHVSTREYDGKIIFLRKLQPGGSNHSFGIHVAKLAGMPKALVSRASEILQQLESSRESVGSDPQKNKPQTQRISAPVQMSFFDAPAPDPKMERLKEQVENLELNSMTPIECMLKLNELKKILE